MGYWFHDGKEWEREMRTILRQAIRNSSRRENYLMERRIHEIQEAEDQEDQAEKTEDQEGEVDKANSGQKG